MPTPPSNRWNVPRYARGSPVSLKYAGVWSVTAVYMVFEESENGFWPASRRESRMFPHLPSLILPFCFLV